MRRADRLFALIQILRLRRFTTAKCLGEDLGVSERTIYRDIEVLQASGIPILGEAGVGYRLQKGFELPPLTFNAEEIDALVLGARMVESWGDSSLASAAKNILTKIEAVLPEILRETLQKSALFTTPFPQRAPSHLTLVRQAVTENRKLLFGYRDQGNLPSQRVVCPLGLYFWGRVWLLASWCEMRADYRSFRLDRMLDVSLHPDPFVPSGFLTLASFVAAMERRGPTPPAELPSQTPPGELPSQTPTAEPPSPIPPAK